MRPLVHLIGYRKWYKPMTKTHGSSRFVVEASFVTDGPNSSLCYRGTVCPDVHDDDFGYTSGCTTSGDRRSRYEACRSCGATRPGIVVRPIGTQSRTG